MASAAEMESLAGHSTVSSLPAKEPLSGMDTPSTSTSRHPSIRSVSSSATTAVMGGGSEAGGGDQRPVKAPKPKQKSQSESEGDGGDSGSPPIAVKRPEPGFQVIGE